MPSSSTNFDVWSYIVGLFRAQPVLTFLKEEDWQEVLQFAERHLVRPYLLQQWSDQKIDVSGHVHQALQDTVRKITLRILLNQLQQQQVLDLFAKNSFDVVPFKGITWAKDLYQHVDRRESSDIDIMIRQRDIEKIRTLLLAHGYSEYFSADAAQRKKIMQVQPEYNYVYYDAHGTGHLIEPHHRTNHPYAGFYFTYEDLEAMVVKDAAGQCHYTPEGTCVLITINNGVNEGWQTLKYLLDLHLFLVKYPDCNWSAIRDHLTRTGLFSSLLCGIGLCAEVFGNTIPEDYSEAMNSQRIRNLVRNRISVLKSHKNQFRLQLARWRYNFWSRDNPAVAMKVLYLQFILPTHDDYRFILLPAKWFFLYPAVRIFRILKKYLS